MGRKRVRDPRWMSVSARGTQNSWQALLRSAEAAAMLVHINPNGNREFWEGSCAGCFVLELQEDEIKLGMMVKGSVFSGVTLSCWCCRELLATAKKKPRNKNRRRGWRRSKRVVPISPEITDAQVAAAARMAPEREARAAELRRERREEKQMGRERERDRGLNLVDVGEVLCNQAQRSGVQASGPEEVQQWL